MTATTFKLMLPTGECRRATFNHVPDKAALDSLVAGANSDRPSAFVYRDSEGDLVLIKDSKDVAEAVRDANQSGAQSVKLHLRKGRSHCGTRHQQAPCRSTTTTCAPPSPKCARPQWLWQGHPTSWPFARPPQAGWGRPCHRRPHHVKVGLGSDEWRHIMRDVNAVFGSLFCTPESAPESGSAGGDEGKAETTAGEQDQHNASPAKQPPSCEDASAESDVVDVAQESMIAAQEAEVATADEGTAAQKAALDEATKEASPVPGGEAAAPQATFVVIEAEKAEAEAEADEAPPAVPEETGAAAAAEDADISAKVQLLAEMGFDLPADIAASMIRELGGRMDLIVRALVANGK